MKQTTLEDLCYGNINPKEMKGIYWGVLTIFSVENFSNPYF